MGPPTAEQLEVLAAYIDSGTVKDAAAKLGLREGAARGRLTRLYAGIGVRHSAAATAWCDDHLPGWREGCRAA